jgi:molybdate transport repressor ModE-like protein
MDLQVAHLRTLQAIAHHGSFSRAAQALNLTQPAVSMQVRHLEQALGLPLLERSPAGSMRRPPSDSARAMPGST